MKKLFIAFCWMTAVLPTFADGDKGEGWQHYYYDILKYERQFNLLYVSVFDSLKYKDDEGVSHKCKVISNLAIYSVGSDSVTYLFDNSFDETIHLIYYEANYDSVEKDKIAFYNSQGMEYDYGTDLDIRNNHSLPPREVADKMFIITYSPQRRTYTLWMAHKTGKNLQRIDDSLSCHLDVFNKTIRIVVQKGDAIKVRNVPY